MVLQARTLQIKLRLGTHSLDDRQVFTSNLPKGWGEVQLSSKSVSVRGPSCSSHYTPIASLASSDSLVQLYDHLVSTLLLLDTCRKGPVHPRGSPTDGSLTSLSMGLESVGTRDYYG